MNGTSEPHARHDRYLVAALAAEDLEPSVRIDAEALVASCRDCAELLADLRSIAVATAALPQVPRTRDFRISAADAARLQPRGWRALLDALGGARASFSRPLATGLTTLGIVGLLVSAVPGALNGISFGSGGAAASPASLSGAAAPEAGRNSAGSPGAALFGSDGSASGAPAYATSAPSAAATTSTQVVDQASPAAASGRPGQAVGSALPVTGGAGGIPPGGSKGGQRAGVGIEARGTAINLAVRGGGTFLPSGRTTGPSLLLIGSIVCLALGAGLFVIRRLARQ
jgi:hypothetical protein